MLHVYIVQKDKSAEFDLIFLTALNTPHDPLESARAGVVHAVSVVEFLRSVDADAEEKLIVMEEPAPVIIKQNAIGLQRIADLLAGRAVLLL
jgi:hypothetical protein